MTAEPGDEPVLSSSMLTHFARECEVFAVTRPAPASATSYFDSLYAENPDPWGLSSRFYERRKRNVLMASLPREHFRRAFEPGCATGLLTAELARRCDELEASDASQAAVDQTTARFHRRHEPARVLIERRKIPQSWPLGRFDLIVISEIGYYCPDQALLKSRIDTSLAADGVLVACHWRHSAPDHPVAAEDVHTSLGAGLRRTVAHREADFVLDVWTRDGTSVATGEGLV